MTENYSERQTSRQMDSGGGGGGGGGSERCHWLFEI